MKPAGKGSHCAVVVIFKKMDRSSRTLFLVPEWQWVAASLATN